jgi:hypothetical protein
LAPVTPVMRPWPCTEATTERKMERVEKTRNMLLVVVVVGLLSEMEAESVYKGKDAMCESGRKRSEEYGRCDWGRR